MIKNALKSVIRSIKRQKGYSFINISGLSIGLLCVIFIMMWVQDELTVGYHAIKSAYSNPVDLLKHE